MNKSKSKLDKSRKYLIIEQLQNLPHRDYVLAKDKLPILMCVSHPTFRRWLNAKKNDRLEIPADKMAIIARFCGCKMEDLFNYPIPQYNLQRLKNMEIEEFAKQLNLVR